MNGENLGEKMVISELEGEMVLVQLIVMSLVQPFILNENSR